IPFKIWPLLDVTTLWDTWPVQHKPYHEKIVKAIQEYHENKDEDFDPNVRHDAL
ncbi:hypothetical protein Golob_012129, partial [Gossypium lobatum]|nr:hypothetical protein [Gossypium lobatum]